MIESTIFRPLATSKPLFSGGHAWVGLAQYHHNKYNRYNYKMLNPLGTYSAKPHKPYRSNPVNSFGKKVLPTITKKTMPKKRVYRKKRRTYRRKKSIIPQQVVPKSRLVKMRLCERILLTSTSGAIANKSILYNGLQDPLLTDSTNQPYYYDQIKTMYRSGTILGAKVTIQFHNTSSTVPCVVGLYQLPWDNSQTLSSYEFWREISAKGRQRILSSEIDVATFVLKNSTRKHLGIKDAKDNSDLVCDIENDGDPTRLLYNVFFCQAVDQTSTATAEAIITLEQIVLLQHPYSPARSVDA